LALPPQCNSSFPLLFITPRLPAFTLFPYTTLFRSIPGAPRAAGACGSPQIVAVGGLRHRGTVCAQTSSDADSGSVRRQHHRFFRSEEHTSELQSRENLVCRLPLV